LPLGTHNEFSENISILIYTKPFKRNKTGGDKPNIDDRGGDINNAHFPLPFLRMSVICMFF